MKEAFQQVEKASSYLNLAHEQIRESGRHKLKASRFFIYVQTNFVKLCSNPRHANSLQLFYRLDLLKSW